MLFQDVFEFPVLLETLQIGDAGSDLHSALCGKFL